MKLDPESFALRLKNFGFNEEVISEVKNCIEVKNIWVEEKERWEMNNW